MAGRIRARSISGSVGTSPRYGFGGNNFMSPFAGGSNCNMGNSNAFGPNGGHFNGSDNMNPFGGNNNMNGNDLMQAVNTLASNFNMNSPSPSPTRFSCGELRAQHCGMLVELTGRLVKKRVARFAELRDRSGGATQLVILEDKHTRISRRFSNMPADTILTIVGLCTLRPKNSCNHTMPTGEIEVEVQEILRLEIPPGPRRTGEKRSYSTMSQSRSITSTEYKIAKSDNILKYFENREITCDELRLSDVGRVVTLVGWIPTSGNSKFQQLKDGYGQTQIIVEEATLRETFSSAPDQTLVQVTGKVVARPKNNANMKFNTGEIEVIVKNVKVLNPDDPYDGPIRDKEKIEKMSIDDYNESDQSGAPTNDVKIEDLDIAKIADCCKFTDRTHTCGELTSANVGDKVVICGWLEFQRMGKFLVLRDGYGQTQVLLSNKRVDNENGEENITLESIVRVEGIVIPRPSPTINSKMKTGEIEVDASKVEVINPAIKNLPFVIRTFNRAGERLRLAHRYLDLRFADMQRNLRTRSAVIMRMREYLINYLGFVEVETPTLFRSTPGGAQEFVVPTRKRGHFYSLVQSPQQFKQMLMAGAIDRYFQVARCYRDEATRPDRQPEFTQLDIELSFTNRDNIMQLVEETLFYCWPKEYPKIKIPFDRLTYEQAMEKYGSDKPDTRFDFTLNNVSYIIEKNESIKTKYKNFAAYAIYVKKEKAFLNVAARKHYDDLCNEFSGTLFIRKFQNTKDLNDRLSNIMGLKVAKELISDLSLQSEDLLFLAIGEKVEAQTVLGKIRLDYQNFLIDNKKVPKYTTNNFVWIIDFPMFMRNNSTNELESVHHPFTAPHPDDMDDFINAKIEELEKIRSQAYDLVLNGQEIGGGSIRIHNRDIQHFVLEQILKIPHEHLSHLLDALASGCPPHGGIALGLDRLLSIICRAPSIRDVIAFPKSLNGRDPLSNAPVQISEKDKQLYHLTVADNADDEAETLQEEEFLEDRPLSPRSCEEGTDIYDETSKGDIKEEEKRSLRNQNPRN